MKKTVIIIGAGPAGLASAYKLLKETDFEVFILEKTNKIGGISRTENYKGNLIDIGGHRFFSKSNEVQNFYNDIGQDIFLERIRSSKIYYKNSLLDYPIKLSPQLFKVLGLKDTFFSGIDYLKSLILKRDEKSLEDFYINQFGEYLYSIFFKGYTEKLWGISPNKLDPSFGKQRVKGVSVTSVLKEALFKNTNEESFIDKFLYPMYGPGQFFEKLADEITEMGGKILFDNKATTCVLENGLIKSINNIECDYVISSMPIKDLVILLDDIPFNVKYNAIKLPYRDFNTVGVLLDDIKIKTKDNWNYIQDTRIKCGRLQMFHNWSRHLVKDNNYWIGMEYFLNKGDKYWNSSDNKFINFAVFELEKLGFINKKNIIDTVRIKEEKAYPAYFGTYKNFDIIKDYLNNIDNLYCIGRNGQHRYNNMDHSILTGFKAVESIQNLIDKELIWKINTEEKYQE